jgi:hypothetical protein
MKNKYRFKLNQRVMTQTGLEGRVIARFHPDGHKDINTYLVELDKEVNVEQVYGDWVRGFSFAEFFLTAVVKA